MGKKNIHRRMALLMALAFLFLSVLSAHAEAFDGHPAFRRKDRGTCRELSGRVILRIVYVDEEQSLWTAAEQASFRKTVAETMEQLADAAVVYGKEIQPEFLEFQVAADYDEIADFDAFVAECLRLNRELKQSAVLLEDVENVCTIFAFVNEKRSLAYADWEGMLNESILANSHDTSWELMHEMLHLFGAVDLYFPAAFEQTAMEYFPDSIMLNTAGSRTVDNLTAYSIGWTDRLDEKAVLFLQATEHVTQDDLDKAYEDELYNGYTIRHNESNTCFGYFENGLLNGYGVCKWDNGDWYAGNFQNGIMHGNGTYHWAGGTVYTGSYVNGRRTGEGCLVWADGTLYTGTFEDGKITGEGMYAWKDGSSYSGGVENGAFHGYGIYTDAAGNMMEGQWDNGVFVK